jgi:DNA processing protein
MDKKDLGLRFSYHIYKSRKLKYRLFDQYKGLSLDNYPPGLNELLFSEECDSFVANERLRCSKLNYKIVSFLDSEYPSSILHFKNMPPCIFVEGEMPGNEVFIAIVGSRKASSYGLSVAFSFSKEISDMNKVVISGLAYGIDTQAHQGALMGKGKTVAVLGCSLEHSYPKSNQNLRNKIVNQGAVISEFPLGTPPAPYLFPVRNRIISALSQTVLVVEAAEKSGALITVDYALDQGKEIYAIPGNINSSFSKGTNQLIKNGANICTCVSDLLSSEEISLFPKNKQSVSMTDAENKTPLESQILNILNSGPLTTSEIIEKNSCEARETLHAITILELKGEIELVSGKYVKL